VTKVKGILSRAVKPSPVCAVAPDKERFDGGTSQRIKGASSETSGEQPTKTADLIRSDEEATAGAQFNHREALMMGPTLTLLLMLRHRQPRSRDARWRESSLPAGCVLAARYRSR